jgi:mono/diheme cytochrome c family protein
MMVCVVGAPCSAKAAAARGESLAAGWCAQCHAVKPSQVSADPAAPTFSELAAEPSVTESAIRVLLRTPHSTMPNFMINADDIDDIASYILSLRPKK